MNKKKGISPSVLIFITLVTTSLFLYAYASGAKGPEGSYFKEYTDINKLVDSVTYKIDIPEYVVNYSSNNEVHAENIMGQIIQIDCSEFAFKASRYLNNDADILGLYNKAETDNRYNILENDRGIHYFRYRVGYKDYPNTTLINWNTEETAHGIMLAYIITEDEALDFIGLNKAKLTDIHSEQTNNTVIENSILTESYIVGDNVQIKLPKFNSNISIIDNGTYASFYIDNELLFILEYTGVDSGIEAFYSIYNANNICIKYMNKGHDANNDYNLFKNNILEIKDSITILK